MSISGPRNHSGQRRITSDGEKNRAPPGQDTGGLTKSVVTGTWGRQERESESGLRKAGIDGVAGTRAREGSPRTVRVVEGWNKKGGKGKELTQKIWGKLAQSRGETWPHQEQRRGGISYI